ncbi:hypothetical protein M8C21_027930, partial [Ambrosia artemisiifolia]
REVHNKKRRRVGGATTGGGRFRRREAFGCTSTTTASPSNPHRIPPSALIYLCVQHRNPSRRGYVGSDGQNLAMLQYSSEGFIHHLCTRWNRDAVNLFLMPLSSVNKFLMPLSWLSNR